MPSFFAPLVKRLHGWRRQPEELKGPEPEITPEMRAEAKGHVNGWLYEIRGNFGPNDFIPFKAIAGWWRVDATGEIIEGSYEANPDFKGPGSGGTYNRWRGP